MAKEIKSGCPKCDSKVFVKATDGSNKHFCHGKGCGHVWIPGIDATKRVDVHIQRLQKENYELQQEINKLRVENKALKAQIFNDSGAGSAAPASDEIFS